VGGVKFERFPTVKGETEVMSEICVSIPQAEDRSRGWREKPPVIEPATAGERDALINLHLSAQPN
jgi:hypothetical protein